MSRDPSDNNQHLPAWLRNVPLPSRPSGVNTPAEQPLPDTTWSDAATPAEDVPDWLRELSNSPADPSPSSDLPSDLPSWRQSAPPAESASPTPANNVPDWLRDTTPTEGTSSPSGVPNWLHEVTPPENTSPTNDVPNWLQSAAPTEGPATTPSGDVPDWLHKPAERASAPAWLSELPSATDAIEPPRDTPDWLQNTAEIPTNEPEAPEWLRDQTSSNTRPSSSASDASLWLDELPPVSPADTTLPELPANEDEGVPSWLRDIPMDEVRQVMSDEGSNKDITATPFSFEGADAPTSTAPKSEVPAWLGNLASDTPAETSPSWLDTLTTQHSSASSATPEPDVPAWLRGNDVQPPLSASPASPAPTAPEPDAPDWLQDSSVTTSTPETSSVDFSTPLSGAPVSSSTPPWLQEAGATVETPLSPPATGAPDWLEPVVPVAPAQPAADIPAWLREAAPTPAPAREAPVDQDIPAWLREAAPTPAPEAPVDQDIPAWLREASATTPVASAEDVPDWLQPAVPIQPVEVGPSQQASAPVAPAPAEDVPDWLRATVAPAPIEEAPSATELPAWLRATEPPAETSAPTEPPVVPIVPNLPAPAEDLPPWLRDESGTPLPTAADSNLPAWLRGASIDEVTAPSTPPDTIPATNATIPLPTWVGEGEAAQAPAQRSSASSSTESGFLGGADLPAWLRPPEAATPAPIDAEAARSLNWLTRISPAEDESFVPEDTTDVPKLALRQAPVRTAAHNQALTLLERLAAEPFPAAAPLPASAPASTWQRIGVDRVLYLLLLLSLVLALAVPSLVASLQAPPYVPASVPLFRQLDTLTSQDVVLVGYEWDARRVSELRPLERAVLGHLIAKGVKLVLVSTDPQGTLLSYDMRYTLASAGYNPGGSDYIILGYKPGGELALRQIARNLPGVLASDFQGQNANIGGLANGLGTKHPLKTLQDFSAILVLADDPVDVQGWMEQVHRSAPTVPIAFMLPEETAPMTQPYMRQPNVFSLAGKAGALSYENLRGETGVRKTQLLQESGQQRLGLLVFVVLFVVGAIAVGVTNALERRKRGL